MKITKDVRDAYGAAKSSYERLSEEVCKKLRPKIEERHWFFISRLKEQESFALKIETGRVDNPSRMEDFFASTVIVPTVADIFEAECLLTAMYDMKDRRPTCNDTTYKKASDFVFDDLRLYLKRGANDTGRNDDLKDLVFEVQVKTILQHAWGIASHDLIYKTADVSWPKERIAFQVKAMLEHAEIAIAEAERLATSPVISKKDRKTTATLQIIEVLNRVWDSDRLPKDKKRLADNIHGVLNTCDIKTRQLQNLLKAEEARVGVLPSNLSPYAFLVQALANSTKLDFRAKITSVKNKKIKIFVHDDMELPEWMKEPNDKIIRL